MLLQYARAAMRRAAYKQLPDSEGWYGEIPGFQGVWANANTEEQCREELQEVLEGWLILRLRHDLDVPVVDGVDLDARSTEQEVA